MVPVALTFGATLGIVFGAYWFFVLRQEQEDQNALKKRLDLKKLPRDVSRALLQQQETPLSTLPFLNRVLRRATGVTDPMERLIDRSGMKLTVAKLLLMCGCAGALTFVVVNRYTHLWILAAILACIAAYVPVVYVRFQAGRRLLKFEEQFPEAIDLLSRSLKAGHAFSAGLSMVANEMPQPVGGEFRLAYDRQNFGMPLPDALRGLAQRVPLLDARFFVTAVLTQREAGGNLSEVLDNLASVIRERFKVKRQVRVVTAHARMTGFILAALPPVLGMALLTLSPGSMSLLWEDPLGVKMIVTAVILQVTGTLIIKKLVNIEY
jgi:tight adherence protein B